LKLKVDNVEKIVVTGLGTINGVGKSVKETWGNIINGVSGVAPITLFDATDYMVKIACEVKDYRPEDYIPAKEVRRRDRFEQFAAIAAQEALQQAGIPVNPAFADRVGVVISSAIGGFSSMVEGENVRLNEGSRRLSPFLIPMLMSNGAAGLLTIDYGFQGPSFSVASACASGADGIGMAWMLLRAGEIDVAVTGGSEATIMPLGVAAFDRIGAMSRRNDDYANTPQPFDKNRDGLVMGEGAGILVLERESHARKRGVEILAELAAYAATSDGFHITAPSENGAGGAKAIRKALDTAGVNIDQVGYINAHGTATVLNDLSETKAIKLALGEKAYNVPISSTKSMTGHMMGATGALEAIFSIQAIRNGILPPTIHYRTPDPECDLDYIPNVAREKKVNTVLSNAFGFGGHNAVLVLREYN
jgi:3-oxoacyl-[acyl-carrier-protein] synthase II